MIFQLPTRKIKREIYDLESNETSETIVKLQCCTFLGLDYIIIFAWLKFNDYGNR